MPRNLLRIGAAALVAVLLSGSAQAAVTKTDRRKARIGANYLVESQAADGSIGAFSPVGSTADAILSLVAARRAPRAINRAVAYLEATAEEVNTVGLKAKVVLALHAAGRDPVLAGRDLVAEIVEAQGPTGQYGSDPAGVLSHALAMIALASQATPVDADAVAWLLDARCSGGGWQFDVPAGPGDDPDCWDGTDSDFTTADTNTTSYALQALAFAPPGTGFTRKLRYLRAVRDPVKGGWGYSREFSLTDANSTTLALQAFKAHGVSFPKGAKRALRQLQYRPCSPKRGAFAYTWEQRPNGNYRRTGPDAGATISGILGLLERRLPIRYSQVTRQAPKPSCR